MEQTPRMTLAGKILSGLVVAFMALSAAGKLTGQAAVVEMFTQKFGFQASTISTVGVLELACAILFAVPQTAVLGAILIAAYFGGATATHVRVGDAFLAPVILGALPWVALVLREPSLRALLPFRR
jgi:hypothetical protein